MSLLENGRINLVELKINIAKRLGPERTHEYFNSLRKLLSNRLSKAEFNKVCLSILGPENVALHNQLIRSILKNAVSAKVPPPALPGHIKVPTKVVDQLSISSNGDISRKNWYSCQHNKDKVRSLSANGILDECDLKRMLQQHHSKVAEQPLKRPRTERLPSHGQSFTHDLVVMEDEDFRAREDLISDGSLLCAPLGIPSYPASLRGRCKFRSSFLTNYDYGELCQTEALQQRMRKIAELQDVEGVTVDCANLLNHGMDAYLKRLIKSSLEIVGTRSSNQSLKQIYQRKPINGAWTGNYIHIQNEQRTCQVSLRDFKVAMQLNPQQLGEDWPLLLEKICLGSFEG